MNENKKGKREDPGVDVELVYSRLHQITIRLQLQSAQTIVKTSNLIDAWHVSPFCCRARSLVGTANGIEPDEAAVILTETSCLSVLEQHRDHPIPKKPSGKVDFIAWSRKITSIISKLWPSRKLDAAFVYVLKRKKETLKEEAAGNSCGRVLMEAVDHRETKETGREDKQTRENQTCVKAIAKRGGVIGSEAKQR
ncbi:uncharacterized protein V6R79_025909 [Siganus canaliculatus]